MKLLENAIQEPFMTVVEHRPWGYYGLYADNIKCTTKILYIRRSGSLSLQYHFRRDQEYLILDNDFTIEYSDMEVPDSIINEPNEDWKIINFNQFLKEHLIVVNGNEGDIFGFKRKVIHRATYYGSREYGRCLDIAFGENDEQDIYRIADHYGRENIKLK